MVTRVASFFTSLFLLLTVRPGLTAAEFYVAPPPLGNNKNPGTEELPFATIQNGINRAADGDTVIVARGTYVENISFGGKNIVLRSTNPLNWSVVASTIIDGNQSGSVVAFDSTEDETCILSGFTIRNGSGSDYVSPAGTRPGGGGILGGDHYERRTRATIQNNLIVGNSATEGGGIAICDGLIRNNLLIGNHADPSQPGGGLLMCNGIIEGNLVAGNTSNCGGGISHCNAVIRNNTVVGNFATTDGGGLSFCGTRDFAPRGATITNNIVWGNDSPLGPQIHDSDPASYCCIQDWAGGGTSNISLDPRFVDSDGPDDNPATSEDNDYRLSAASPCIDVGKYEKWMSEAVDLIGNPRILVGASSVTVDIGAYEYRFAVTKLTTQPEGTVELTWDNHGGTTYAIWSCMGLSPEAWTEEGTVTPKGSVGAWTDADTPGPCKFYRIELK